MQAKTSQEIYDAAYQIAIKNEIAECFSSVNYSLQATKALMKSPNLLQDIYEESATISFLQTFGFITVFLLVLSRFLEVTGVWLAVPFAELFTLMLTVYLICRHRKQYHYF